MSTKPPTRYRFSMVFMIYHRDIQCLFHYQFFGKIKNVQTNNQLSICNRFANRFPTFTNKWSTSAIASLMHLKPPPGRKNSSRPKGYPLDLLMIKGDYTNLLIFIEDIWRLWSSRILQTCHCSDLRGCEAILRSDTRPVSYWSSQCQGSPDSIVKQSIGHL